jgi:hypothetical protein
VKTSICKLMALPVTLTRDWRAKSEPGKDAGSPRTG